MGDSLFNQDIVRDFMISKGGKVRNHDLVSHFKSFLNDPHQKVANRQKFKTFVNTLSSVKLDESGEKVLVLKRKFRNDAPNDATSVPARPSPQLHRPKKQKMLDSFPLRAPSPEEDKSAASPEQQPQEPQEQTDPVPRIPQETPLNESLEIAAEEGQDEVLSGPSLLAEIQNQMAELVERADDPREDTSRENSPVKERNEGSSFVATPEEEEVPGASGGSAEREEDPLAGVEEAAPPSPPSAPNELSSPPPDAVIEVVTPQTQKITEAKTPISVKERAKHLNRMTSDVDVQKPLAKHIKKEYDDSIEVISLSAADREWITAAAAADYHPMNKLLVSNPQLAKRKDFITGYTPLHWACKQGKTEVVKLICAYPEVNVNARSFGGYTPLHLAAMQGHEEVIEMLVQAYGADSNLRDYSGKKAKQYLRNSASTRAQQLLQNRRPSAASAGAAPFRRTGSYSSKIRSTGHFGIAAGTAVRNSWAQLAQAERRGSSQESLPSPKPSPKQSPQTWRKQSHSGSQELTMPPPRDLPVRHRRQSSRRDNKENHSDSELGAGGLTGSETDLTVGMDSAASYPNISVQKASYV